MKYVYTLSNGLTYNTCGHFVFELPNIIYGARKIWAMSKMSAHIIC